MKQFISNIKNLSQKAAEIKAAMQQVPPKVAEIREAVASTAGQLQQLRVDVQSTVADLKADNEHHLSQAMQEINASVDIFMEAGFELGGMDLELSPVQRLLVHLDRLEEVHPSALRALISANQHRRTTHALLTSMLQAQEMADTVQLGELTKFDYRELIVSIGPIPSVRICWRTEVIAQEPAAQTAPANVLPPPVTAAVPVTQPIFGQGSFFEKRPPQPAAIAVQPTATAPEAKMSPAASTLIHASRAMEAAHASPSPESSDPLARFKKMPDFFKHKR